MTGQREGGRNVDFWSLFAPICPSFIGGHGCRVGGPITRCVRCGNADASATQASRTPASCHDGARGNSCAREAGRGTEASRARTSRHDGTGTRSCVNHRASRASRGSDKAS